MEMKMKLMMAKSVWVTSKIDELTKVNSLNKCQNQKCFIIALQQSVSGKGKAVSTTESIAMNFKHIIQTSEN
jgi:hypothetical protein